MPCFNQFHAYLDLEHVDFEPETLIVGTFNPAWPENCTTGWFYGRTESCFFWDILPRIYGTPSLINGSTADWKNFCKVNRVAITNVIAAIDDADEQNREHSKMLGGLSDKSIIYNFDDFVYTDITGLLKRHPSIKHVYITRGTTEAFWKHTWNPVVHYCNANNIYEQKLLTPTTDSLYHYEAYNNEHPAEPIASFQDYLLQRWKEVWHSRNDLNKTSRVEN